MPTCSLLSCIKELRRNWTVSIQIRPSVKVRPNRQSTEEPVHHIACRFLGRIRQSCTRYLKPYGASSPQALKRLSLLTLYSSFPHTLLSPSITFQFVLFRRGTHFGDLVNCSVGVVLRRRDLSPLIPRHSTTWSAQLPTLTINRLSPLAIFARSRQVLTSSTGFPTLKH
jgi:hypothetical protein